MISARFQKQNRNFWIFRQTRRKDRTRRTAANDYIIILRVQVFRVPKAIRAILKNFKNKPLSTVTQKFSDSKKNFQSKKKQKFSFFFFCQSQTEAEIFLRKKNFPKPKFWPKVEKNNRRALNFFNFYSKTPQTKRKLRSEPPKR